MAVSAAVATGVLGDVLSETTDLTVTDFGTPEVALFFYSSASTQNNPQNGGCIGFGAWCDGGGTPQQSACGYQSSNNQGSATLYMANNGSAAIETGVSIAAQASTITDGIRLTVSEDNTGLNR